MHCNVYSGLKLRNRRVQSLDLTQVFNFLFRNRHSLASACFLVARSVCQSMDWKTPLSVSYFWIILIPIRLPCGFLKLLASSRIIIWSEDSRVSITDWHSPPRTIWINYNSYMGIFCDHLIVKCSNTIFSRFWLFHHSWVKMDKDGMAFSSILFSWIFCRLTFTSPLSFL